MISLVLIDWKRDCDILTVNNTTKWYCLYLVTPDGGGREVTFDELEPFVCSSTAAYVDHVPNPHAVLEFATAMGYALHPIAYEMMIGRWETEAIGGYPVL